MPSRGTSRERERERERCKRACVSLSLRGRGRGKSRGAIWPKVFLGYTLACRSKLDRNQETTTMSRTLFLDRDGGEGGCQMNPSRASCADDRTNQVHRERERERERESLQLSKRQTHNFRARQARAEAGEGCCSEDDPNAPSGANASGLPGRMRAG